MDWFYFSMKYPCGSPHERVDAWMDGRVDDIGRPGFPDEAAGINCNDHVRPRTCSRLRGCRLHSYGRSRDARPRAAASGAHAGSQGGNLYRSCHARRFGWVHTHVGWRRAPTDTTGFSRFAECRLHSAKASLHSANSLPSVTLGKHHSTKLPTAQ